jgi:hypothetical protein
MRIVQRAVAFGLYLLFRRHLLGPARVHQAGGGSYDSMWKPGLIAVFALGFVENLVVILLVTKLFA